MCLSIRSVMPLAVTCCWLFILRRSNFGFVELQETQDRIHNSIFHSMEPLDPVKRMNQLRGKMGGIPLFCFLG